MLLFLDGGVEGDTCRARERPDAVPIVIAALEESGYGPGTSGPSVLDVLSTRRVIGESGKYRQFIGPPLADDFCRERVAVTWPWRLADWSEVAKPDTDWLTSSTLSRMTMTKHTRIVNTMTNGPTDELQNSEIFHGGWRRSLMYPGILAPSSPVRQ